MTKGGDDSFFFFKETYSLSHTDAHMAVSPDGSEEEAARSR